MKVTIRPAKAEDEKVLKKLHDHLVDDESFMTDYPAGPNGLDWQSCFVAEVDNVPAGYLQGWFNAFDEAAVQQLYVLPKFRRLGIATKLLKVFSTIADGFGCRFMSVSVLGNNRAASRVYAKAGFTPHLIEMRQLLPCPTVPTAPSV